MRGGALHEARVALLLDLFGHRAIERIGARAGDRRILEAADAIELRLIEPVEQHLEVGVGLAGKADDEGAAQREFRAFAAPAVNALQRVLGVRRAGACA